MLFLADVVMQEAQYLAQTDRSMFVGALAVEAIESLALDADVAERVDAFVARFGRLQDTLAGALLPRLPESLLEPQGSVFDNLNRAERRGWIRSSAAGLSCACCATLGLTRTSATDSKGVEALNAAHLGVENLVNAAALLARRPAITADARRITLRSVRAGGFGQS